MKKILFTTFVIFFTFCQGCSQFSSRLSSTPTLLATVEASPTFTQVETPIIPKPSKYPSLLPVNNRSITWENHTWVVKNGYGLVTATWDQKNNNWVYRKENLQMVLSGITLPNSRGGIGSYVIQKQIAIPGEWKTAIPSNNIDSAPIVPLGYIGTLEEANGKDKDGNIWHLQEFGVDFRGIKRIFLESDPKNLTGHDIYLAGFTLTNPQFPDRLYLITLPLNDNELLYTNFDIFTGGTYAQSIGSYTIIPPPDGIVAGFSLHDLIKVLQNPSVIGRRMCLQIWVSENGKSSNRKDIITDAFYQTGQNILADAIKNGTPFEDVETGINEQSLRVPHDLHNLEPDN